MGSVADSRFSSDRCLPDHHYRMEVDEMNDFTRADLKKLAADAESVLDQFYLWMVALPPPWTLVATVAIVVALLATRWIAND